MQSETYPTREEQRNNREKQSTQYLTRFGKCLRPRDKGERDFINSTINYNLFLLQGISNRDFQWDFQGYNT